MPLQIVNKTFSDVITFSRATSATYYDSNGILKTAAPNEVRFDHDPLTLKPKGFLVEKENINFLYHSSGFEQSEWVKQNCTVGLGFPSPDGGYNARRITGTSIDCSLYQSFNALGSTYYTFSFWIKALNSVGTSINVKLLKGTSETLVASSTITPSYWSWTRVSITGAFTGAFGWIFDGPSKVVIGGDASLGFNESYLIYGAQLEIGTYVTSYIPTTTEQATKAADVVDVNVGSWLNDREGTMYVDCIPVANPLDIVLLDYTDRIAFSLYSSKSVDQYTSYHADLSFSSTGKAAFDVRNGGSIQVRESSTSNFIVGINKMIGAYKENDFAFTLNGESVKTDTQASVPTSLDRAKVGDSWLLTRTLDGWIRRVAYYPRRLSNEELQSLTVI